MLADLRAYDLGPGGEEGSFGQTGIPVALLNQIAEDIRNQSWIARGLGALFDDFLLFGKSSFITVEEVVGEIAFTHRSASPFTAWPGVT